ncbi:hypothetical protein RB2654_08507 [Rhodobacterales bacterium HTCC2654]|jgi:hypothetical protein|uniref:Uncharacterized protein n=1 Tax=Maritimibacter alkaliphilus HTCC2654 TaxID=314271 RepID=A3VHP2_9RHOB|nr:hypothetical protein RB2654_08507 [Rhodobacterales bacterium HTCC2654] [Maritimibacter alkaliphilus HTCC2654]
MLENLAMLANIHLEFGFTSPDWDFGFMEAANG